MRSMIHTPAWPPAARGARGMPSPARLGALAPFGSNPGQLDGYLYVPSSLREAAALVVVLHGCGQTAAAYDAGAGWSEMADRYSFALLFPQQRRANNAGQCFNWFNPDDAQRDGGEAHSISQMVAAVLAAHPLDPGRVFVTGLSAGGAMASVMLATYPDVFAGGAIIAGLCYGSAGSVPAAFGAMRGRNLPSEVEATASIRGASSHDGPWPVVSVWHGSADTTVAPSNARAILGQWRSLHHASVEPTRVERVDGHLRRVWCDASGREVLEEYGIAGLGHGTPLDTRGVEGCGTPGAFMLEAGISSTERICRFWGLAGVAPAKPRHPAPQTGGVAANGSGTEHAALPLEHRHARAGGVANIIDDALRAAGLLR